MMVAPILLGVSVVLTTAGQMLIKRGATQIRDKESILKATLRNGWLLGGLACAVVAPVAYVMALRTLPLSVAFPAASVTHIFVAIGARVFFREAMSLGAWVGIVLIAAGVTLIGIGA